jgi:hypothetical protein
LQSPPLATGDVDTTLAHVNTVSRIFDQAGVSGLPDLLLPFMALAHALGDTDRCRRWLAAIRNDPGRLGTGITMSSYRTHRDAVGLPAEDPLEDATIEAIYDEASTWAQALVD